VSACPMLRVGDLDRRELIVVRGSMWEALVQRRRVAETVSEPS
jgi:hypothetical protein